MPNTSSSFHTICIEVPPQFFSKLRFFNIPHHHSSVDFTMCHRTSLGTKFGCGHILTIKAYEVRDCQSRQCRLSKQHPDDCNHCWRMCVQFWDWDEVIWVQAPHGFCPACRT